MHETESEWPTAKDMDFDAEALFAAFVYKERLRHEWSQQELAKRLTKVGLPIHPSGVTRFERGDRGIRFNEVFAFCDAFQVSIYEVLEFMRTSHEFGTSLLAKLAEHEKNPPSLPETTDIAVTMLGAISEMLEDALRRDRGEDEAADA